MFFESILSPVLIRSFISNHALILNKITILFKIIEIEDGLTIFCEEVFFIDDDLFEKVKQAVLEEYNYHINAVK